MNGFKKAPPYPIMFLTAVKVGNECVNSLSIGILKDLGPTSHMPELGNFAILFLIQWDIHSDG